MHVYTIINQRNQWEAATDGSSTYQSCQTITSIYQALRVSADDNTYISKLRHDFMGYDIIARVKHWVCYKSHYVELSYWRK
jgi:hypothetical protein